MCNSFWSFVVPRCTAAATAYGQGGHIAWTLPVKRHGATVRHLTVHGNRAVQDCMHVATGIPALTCILSYTYTCVLLLSVAVQS